jgi:CRP-like cAMP-binding protein
MTFQSYAKGKLVVKEGHPSTAFFFVLSGQCEIFKVKDQFKHRLGIVKAGECFGERSMTQMHDQRTACVGCTIACELLSIDKGSRA